MKALVCVSLCLMTAAGSVAQSAYHLPVYSVFFLELAPDARSAGMGMAGVASSTDANAVYWNPAKLATAESNFGASASYGRWLKKLVDDMWLGQVAGYVKIADNQAIGLSVNYFNGDPGVPVITSFPKKGDIAYSASYSRGIGRNFSAGLTLKYISSNFPQFSTSSSVFRTARTVAADLSFYYKKPFSNASVEQGTSWALGAIVQNVGGLIDYGTGEKTYLPTALRVGGNMTHAGAGRHKISLTADLSKMLIPVGMPGQAGPVKPVPQAIFNSFSDAPGGFREEMQEIRLSAGAEYWYKNTFALRGGFYGENHEKGNRKLITLGAGLRHSSGFGADFAYWTTVQRGSPLRDTFKVSLIYDKIGKRKS